MKIILQKNNQYQVVKSLIKPGSYKKAEHVLRPVRKLLKLNKNLNMERIISQLRFANSRRSEDLASFLNYLFTSFKEFKISQLYMEKHKIGRKRKFKSRRVLILKSPKYRYVALLNGITENF